MVRAVLLAVVVALLVEGYHAKIDRCVLARELVKTFPRTQINDWLCLADRESTFDPSHVGVNGQVKYYGLFQSSNQYWCTERASPAPNQNKCKVACGTLLTNIDAAIKCAKAMYDQSSPNHWQPWPVTHPLCDRQANLTSYSAGCGI